MNDILKALASSESADLEDLFAFLRIPSVSADPEYTSQVRSCAEWLAAAFRAAGLGAAVEATGGHPVVFAEWRGAPDAATILVYGHYDVQPPDPVGEWTSGPFAPQFRDGKLYARGATDDKGQLFCHLLAVRAHLASRGALPVNVLFLVEGEEEAGSTNLERFIQDHRDRLRCDAVVISDSGQFAEGVPALCYGLRGLAYLEVKVRGPARDLHSGSFGGAVRNPANALAGMLASLHEASGRVAVPGFYDAVRPLEDWERQMFADLPFDEGRYRKDLGVSFLAGEQGYTVLERVWVRPTLDVNGMVAGYTGEGAKTVIPATATAKLSCRLVPDQDPEAVAEAIETRLRALCPAGCSLEVKQLHAARPVLLPVESFAVAAARRAVVKSYGKEPVLVREGGSIPVVEAFQRVLGTPVVLLGFGRPDDGAHGPNEKIDLEDLRKGVRASAWLWEELTEGKG